MREQEALSLTQRNEALLANKSLNKADIESTASDLERRVKDGELDELEVLIVAKKLAELAKAIDEKIRPIADDKVKLGKGEKYTKFDVELSRSWTGVKYYFDKCGDNEWNQASSRKKEREDFLKSLSKTTIIVDEDTGEAITLHPPIKTGKESLQLKLK